MKTNKLLLLGATVALFLILKKKLAEPSGQFPAQTDNNTPISGLRKRIRNPNYA